MATSFHRGPPLATWSCSHGTLLRCRTGRCGWSASMDLRRPQHWMGVYPGFFDTRHFSSVQHVEASSLQGQVPESPLLHRRSRSNGNQIWGQSCHPKPRWVGLVDCHEDELLSLLSQIITKRHATHLLSLSCLRGLSSLRAPAIRG